MPQPYDFTIPTALADYVLQARSGQMFGKLTDPVATIATAIPTTTAAHVLYNGEPLGGKEYELLSVTWVGATSAGAATALGLLGCLNVIALTAQPATADTLTKVTSMNGKVYAGSASTSHTVTVVDDGWWPLPIQSAFPGAGTVTGGLILTAELKGHVIIPPKCVFCVSATSVGTTQTGSVFFRWVERKMTNVLT